MKILAISDVESKYLWDYFQPEKLEGVDLILSCGDLPKNPAGLVYNSCAGGNSAQTCSAQSGHSAARNCRAGSFDIRT